MTKTVEGLASVTSIRTQAPFRSPRLVACVALLAWGVVTFGAVHDWALWPLVGGATILSMTSVPRRRQLFICLSALPVIAAIGLQLVPLPLTAVVATGEGIRKVIANYTFHSGLDPSTSFSLSISPHLTVRALAILTALVALISTIEAYLARSPRACRHLAIGIVGLAVPIALFALVQKATFNNKIYWFWESQFGASNNYYGPFVNRNHFAGWMLLASAVTTGVLIGGMAEIGKRIRPGWRNRILWLSSAEASRAILTAAGLFVMLVSVMWSMSRSGIAGTTLSLLLLSGTALRRLGVVPRRAIAVGTILLILFTAVSWRGADTLAAWYGRTETFAWRVQIWRDTLPALRQFAVAGSGVNTYGTLMLLYPATERSFHAAQAHSDYVQLAVEGGLLVGIPALTLLGLLIRELRKRLKQPQDEMTWWIRAGAVAGICGMALQETVEFSLQIPGIATLFAVLVAIAIHDAGGTRVSVTRPRASSRRAIEVPLCP